MSRGKCQSATLKQKVCVSVCVCLCVCLYNACVEYKDSWLSVLLLVTHGVKETHSKFCCSTASVIWVLENKAVSQAERTNISPV